MTSERYQRRPDGTYAKTVGFPSKHHSRGIESRETLVRSSTGKLLRVERTKRALSLAAVARKKGA